MGWGCGLGEMIISFRLSLTGTILRRPPFEPNWPMLTSFPGELPPSPHKMSGYRLLLPGLFSPFFAIVHRVV